MIPTPEFIRIIQMEREARIRNDHLARIAACARACCNPTLFHRVARAVRGSAAPC